MEIDSVDSDSSAKEQENIVNKIVDKYNSFAHTSDTVSQAEWYIQDDSDEDPINEIDIDERSGTNIENQCQDHFEIDFSDNIETSIEVNCTFLTEK